MSRLVCLRLLTPRPEIRSRSKASSSAFLFLALMRYNAVFLIGSLSILKSFSALPALMFSLSDTKSKTANIPGNIIFSGYSSTREQLTLSLSDDCPSPSADDSSLLSQNPLLTDHHLSM